MPSITSLLNTSKEALLTNQIAMEVTGANVANVNTPGYTRQRPVIGTKSMIETSADQVQTSVQVTLVERVYDRFVEFQLVEQSSGLGYSTVNKETLDRIEATFNESAGGGLSDLLNEFWKAWEDLSANPNGLVERTALVNVSQNLAMMFRQYAAELHTIQGDLNTKIGETVSQLNDYISQIADLNYKIVRGQAGGSNTNDLQDKRADLLKKAGELVDINYVEETGGNVNIFLANGMPLVEGERSWPLAVRVNAAGACDIVYAADPSQVLNGVISTGKLGGMMELRDTTVAGYLDDLDELAGELVRQVNTRHASGYDAYRNAGGDFFQPLTATGARDLRLNGDVAADPNRVAASLTVNGDGDNARVMSELKDALVMSGGFATFNGYYGAFVGQIGQDVAAAERSFSHETSVMNQLVSQREQVSGVSIDEEMINLVKYQMAYGAAAKLAGTADEMAQTLLSLAQ